MTSDASGFVIRSATEDDVADIAAVIEDVEKYYGRATIDDSTPASAGPDHA
jgi:hypothetical protein